VSWSADDGFSTPTTLCELDCFVHSIAPHPHLGDAYVVLARHGTGGSAFDCAGQRPLDVIGLPETGLGL
jgi:hypothetical protein